MDATAIVAANTAVDTAEAAGDDGTVTAYSGPAGAAISCIVDC
jgi:hypothetical protein